ncbi:MAG: putative DNA modification/repair radical SAM protein [Cytophagales bacterium]|nr:MAG: putative DNA modification/repair radical SAM protein [Cytophagales bacterium]
MNNHDRIHEKLSILSSAAKYDVSCSSSGSKRSNDKNGLGNTTGMGICHSYTEDGRCVSLLKILLTNYCIFDCAYCVSRKSNDIKRAAFTVEEVVSLTINFYKRNYIEGLFLSSGIFKDADYTMERLVLIAKKLRLEQRFNGYIHLKTIPGASQELMFEAGLYADRISVNIELPTEISLKSLAPDKNFKDILKPMSYFNKSILGYKSEKKLIKNAPKFAPAGQSTQMIIGATPETDKEVMLSAQKLYHQYNMKRVYYSGYIPIRDNDARLPSINTAPPLLREHRLYQTDWLMRFYGFDVNEILNNQHDTLDADIDPKLSWALRNLHEFPVDINHDSYEKILRVPGIGFRSAQQIVSARKFGKLDWEQLKKIGIAINRAKYFIICRSDNSFAKDALPSVIRHKILATYQSKFKSTISNQLELFL